MDANETAPVSEDAALEDQLSRLETELKPAPAANPDKPVATTDDAKPAIDRAVAAEPPIESELDSKTTDTPSKADETEEVKTAEAQAAKEGMELKRDDKGLPARDAAGKFIKQPKPVAEPEVKLSPGEHKKFAAYLKQTQSKFGQDLGKRLVRWDSIKESEKALETRRTDAQKQLDGAIAKFNADVAAFRSEQESNRPTPEKYETFAAKCSDQAKVKQAEAITAENEGRTEEAEKLRDEAKILSHDAASAKASAENVRKNPPLTLQAQQAKFLENQRTWIGKAVTDFPEFGKKGSELQQAVAEVYKGVVQQIPEAARLPGLVYYCARIAYAETASARVPGLVKELGDAKTKLTELEALTNPTPPGGATRRDTTTAKPFERMTPEEQLAQLQKEAEGQGI